MDEAALYPYSTSPGRLATDVVDALAVCPAVTRVTVLGEIAEGGADGWTPLVVACETDGNEGMWHAAATLRVELPVRWHGLLPGVDSPGGRYWFTGESLFHSLDLRFGAPDPSRPADRRLDRPGEAVAGSPTLTPLGDETAFTAAFFETVEAMRTVLRTGAEWEALRASKAALDRALLTLPQQPAGGRAANLYAELATLYGTLQAERARYGGAG